MELKRQADLESSGVVCHYLVFKSKDLPFVISSMKMSDAEKANDFLQKFVRMIEKRFDSIWYIGTDYFGEDIVERFIFHHGGFLEISLNGKIAAYFKEDKTLKLKKAIIDSLNKMDAKKAIVISDFKLGKRVISLKDSIIRGVI